jgi:nitrate/nitrite transporter NarK
VLYYSAIFPFQRYAPNYLEVTLGVDAATASRLFSCFPILAMCLTPLLGIFLDHKGKGASMLMLGAVIMIVCHLCFAFVLPAFPTVVRGAARGGARRQLLARSGGAVAQRAEDY